MLNIIFMFVVYIHINLVWNANVCVTLVADPSAMAGLSYAIVSIQL